MQALHAYLRLSPARLRCVALTDAVGDRRTQGGRGQPAPQAGIDPYILPVMFGMLEIHPTTFKGTPLTIALISRRSRHRAGTRYFTRGLDDQGHAATGVG